jgi:hypothetical protein
MTPKIFWTIIILYGSCVLIAVGYRLGMDYPQCVPGAQQVYLLPGEQQVRYCNKNGYGWERCQDFSKGYPQALWRQQCLPGTSISVSP